MHLRRPDVSLYLRDRSTRLSSPMLAPSTLSRLRHFVALTHLARLLQAAGPGQLHPRLQLPRWHAVGKRRRRWRFALPHPCLLVVDLPCANQRNGVAHRKALSSLFPSDPAPPSFPARCTIAGAAAKPSGDADQGFDMADLLNGVEFDDDDDDDDDDSESRSLARLAHLVPDPGCSAITPNLLSRLLRAHALPIAAHTCADPRLCDGCCPAADPPFSTFARCPASLDGYSSVHGVHPGFAPGRWGSACQAQR